MVKTTVSFIFSTSFLLNDYKNWQIKRIPPKYLKKYWICHLYYQKKLRLNFKIKKNQTCTNNNNNNNSTTAKICNINKKHVMQIRS